MTSSSTSLDSATCALHPLTRDQIPLPSLARSTSRDLWLHGGNLLCVSLEKTRPIVPISTPLALITDRTNVCVLLPSCPPSHFLITPLTHLSNLPDGPDSIIKIP